MDTAPYSSADEARDVDAAWPDPDKVVTALDIGEAATTTERAERALLALAVGLGRGTFRVCARALGPAIELVATNDAAAAAYLLAVLRPRLVIVDASLCDADGARLLAAAVSCDAELVCIGRRTTGAAIAWQLQRAAANAYGVVFRSPPRDGALDLDPSPMEERHD